MTKQYAPACERNQDPILEILREVLPAEGLVLEIGCGTGQHAVYFSAKLPHLDWQPVDRPNTLESARAWVEEARQPNLCEPRAFDLFDPCAPIARAQAIVSINVIHIAALEAAERLFFHAATILDVGGVVYLYGPFRYADRPLEPSNESFDAWLSARDPASGVRDFEAIDAVATSHGFALGGDVAMPANNRSIWWHKR
ncbi:MAG: DUF938 domain-containing protein [Bradymonadaceae bacterium]|nr:DUF938 domain-containing protein [Lujinxingiaceae bacterium]